MIATAIPEAVAHTNMQQVIERERSRSSSKPSTDNQDEEPTEQDKEETKRVHKEKFYAALAKELSSAPNSSIKNQNQYFKFNEEVKRENLNEKEEDKKQQNKLHNIKRKWMLLIVDGQDYYVSRKDLSLKHLYL